jgi:hypothetical protein
MTWTVLLYRRVGQPPLTLEGVEGALADRPGYERQELEGIVRFERRHGDAGIALEFTQPGILPDDPGSADFPYEETPLALLVERGSPDDPGGDLAGLLADAAALCAELDVLTLAPQSAQEVPLPPDGAALLRGYEHFLQDVAETRAHIRRSSRRYMTIALALLVLSGILFLLASGR